MPRSNSVLADFLISLADPRNLRQYRHNPKGYLQRFGVSAADRAAIASASASAIRRRMSGPAGSSGKDENAPRGGGRVVPLGIFEIGEISEVSEVSEVSEISEISEIVEIKEISEIHEISEIREIGEIKEIREIGEIHEIGEIGEIREIKEIHEISEISEIREIREISEIKEIHEVIVEIGESGESGEIQEFSEASENISFAADVGPEGSEKSGNPGANLEKQVQAIAGHLRRLGESLNSINRRLETLEGKGS